MKGQKGFTLVEILIVIAVLAVLAAIVTPAVSGVVTSARSQGKGGDINSVDNGVTKYRADNSALPITGSTSPSKSVKDGDSDSTVKVKVNTSATDPTGFISDGSADVVCGDGSGNMAASLVECFGALDFSGKLVPDYVKDDPKHPADAVTATADSDGATADLAITGGDRDGNTVEFYLDASIVSGDGLKVWNTDKDANILVLKNDADYGK